MINSNIPPSLEFERQQEQMISFDELIPVKLNKRKVEEDLLSKLEEIIHPDPITNEKLKKRKFTWNLVKLKTI